VDGRGSTSRVAAVDCAIFVMRLMARVLSGELFVEKEGTGMTCFLSK